MRWIWKSTNFGNLCSERKEYLNEILAGPVPKIPSKCMIKLYVRGMKWPVNWLPFSCGAETLIAGGHLWLSLGSSKGLKEWKPAWRRRELHLMPSPPTEHWLTLTVHVCLHSIGYYATAGLEGRLKHKKECDSAVALREGLIQLGELD